MEKLIFMKSKMKISILLILLGFAMIYTFQSCKKYPDGPLISFRSRTERVSNTWKVENYKVNGNDFTSLVSSYTETFSKNGAYSYSWGILNGSGIWSFQNHDNEIKLSGSDSQSSRTLFILKLEEKSFWYYYMDGSDKHESHMILN